MTMDAIVEKPTSRTDWRIIGFYLTAFAAGGVIKPFLSLYLKEVGLSGTQIGLLGSWAAFAGIAVTPLVGVLADRTQRHRLTLSIIVMLKGISSALLVINTATFWLISMVSIRIVTAQAQDAMMNRLTFAYLKVGKRLNLGSIRFWGAISFATTSLMTGWLATDGSISVLFPLAGVMGVLAGFLVGAFPKTMVQDDDPQQADPSVNRRGLRFFFLIIFLHGFAVSGVDTFLFIHVADGLGAGNDLIGLLGALGSIAPIFTFHLTDRMIKRWGSAVVMALGFGVLAMTWASYLFVNSALLTIPLVIIQGLMNPLFLVSMILILGDLGLPKRGATNQMLAQLTIPGIAVIIAQPISGWLFDTVGGQAVLLLAAIIIGFTALLLFKQRRWLSPTT